MESTNTNQIIGQGYQKIRMENFFKSIVFYIGVVITVIWCIFPFVFAILQSFVNANTRGPSIEYIPSDPTLFNYNTVFNPKIFNFQVYILNSAYISILTTVFCVIIASFAAYVLAEYNFRGKPLIMVLVLSMTMFPGIIIVIPILEIYVAFGKLTLPSITFNLGNLLSFNFNNLVVFGTANYPLVNTYVPGLLIPYLSFNLPLTVFLLYNFFQEIPRELILAARVDGATNFQVYRKIILPLAIPGVFTTAILVFIAAWNEFLFASILMNFSNTTIPVALSLFTGIPQVNSGITDQFLSLMAASVLVTTPLVIMVLIFQRQIVSGITAGAIKG